MSLFLNKKDSREENLCFLPESDDLKKKKKKDITKCTHPNVFIIIIGAGDWLGFKENEVKEAIEAAGLEIVQINHQGEWVNITARKN